MVAAAAAASICWGSGGGIADLGGDGERGLGIGRWRIGGEGGGQDRAKRKTRAHLYGSDRTMQVHRTTDVRERTVAL